jgi:hypothetical protein
VGVDGRSSFESVIVELMWDDEQDKVVFGGLEEGYGKYGGGSRLWKV